MKNWTGDKTCENAGASGYTSATSNQNWLTMSIVNGSSDAIFNYQNTKVTGWLCANVYNNESPMNNSSPQGQIFYQTVAAANSTGLAVYAVQNCNGAEGVMGQYAVAPAVPTECDPSRNNQYCGYWAIKEDMSDPNKSFLGVCQHY